MNICVTRDLRIYGRNNVTILCLGKDTFGVDIDKIAEWWILHQGSCTTTALVAVDSPDELAVLRRAEKKQAFIAKAYALPRSELNDR